MKKILLLLVPVAAFGGDTALTLYNQNFAVVRERIKLQLKPGLNEVRFADVSAHLEPESVILRDFSGRTDFHILEQNFRNDPIDQSMMLSLFEGKEIDFLVTEPQKPDRVIKGRVVRSGYTGHDLKKTGPLPTRMAGEPAQPIIEVDGQFQFRLPGTPLFPALPDESILKPELSLQLQSSTTGQLDAELCYVSGGLSWEAHYNLVTASDGETLDLIGWVTLRNHSGKSFENVRVKLMAGEVSKIQQDEQGRFVAARADAETGAPPITQKSFAEYHLYTLQRPLTLRDRETKQVEFVRASGVDSARLYVYEGNVMDITRRGYDPNQLRENESLGLESDSTVKVLSKFKNSKDDGLGVPLPKGRLKFYQRDDDGELEFVGENNINHTPENETVRVHVGNAFDITGERKRIDFKVDSSNNWADESFEITLRNRKKEGIEVRVIEHLFRWVNWEIRENSEPFTKLGVQEIEFRVKLEPEDEKKLTYRVHYSW